MSSQSRRFIKPIAFGALAIVLTALVGGVWTALLSINLSASPQIPWAVVVMGALLWALWRYLGGSWAPSSTSAARREYLRARPLSRPVFVWALAAGLLAIVALAGLWILLFQFAGISGRALPDYSHYPFWTVALALIMSSLVNGVVEEALFRGYFQGILEQRVGGLFAIIITMVVMAPEHALTQGFVLPTLLFYLAVDAMLGAMAYLTRSILPGILTHSVGLLVFFTLIWPGDALRQLFNPGDATLWLWLHSAQAIVFGAVAILAFVHLTRLTRATQPALHAARPLAR